MEVQNQSVPEFSRRDLGTLTLGGLASLLIGCGGNTDIRQDVVDKDLGVRFKVRLTDGFGMNNSLKSFVFSAQDHGQYVLDLMIVSDDKVSSIEKFKIDLTESKESSELVVEGAFLFNSLQAQITKVADGEVSTGLINLSEAVEE